MVKEAAVEARALLNEIGMAAYPKTTGRNGIHLYLRLRPEHDAVSVRATAVALARELERRRPDLITAAWWKEERGTRVFVDFNQNAPHKTVIGAWTVRPRPGGQVSTPSRAGWPRRVIRGWRWPSRPSCSSRCSSCTAETCRPA